MTAVAESPSDTPTQIWLNRMPALGLAKSVPVVGALGSGRLADTGTVTTVEGADIDPDLGEPIVWVQWDDDESPTDETQSDLRIDLGDPQGFGYALRLLIRATEPGGDIDQWRAAWRHHESIWQKHGWLEHHACGSVSDHIRLALAKALAEVF